MESAGKDANNDKTVSSVSSSKKRADDFIQIRIPRVKLSKPALAWGTRIKMLGLVAIIILSSGFGFLGGWLGAARYDGGNTFASSNISGEKKIVTSESQLISKIAKTVGPSVVSVDVISQQPSSNSNFYNLFDFGGGQSQPVEGAGTGIIISSDGLILTNRHVVPAGTTSVSVTLSDGTQLNNVQVLGRTNDNDSLDVAFLKITNAKGHKLTPAVIGNSSTVEVGDNVVAIGNALGQFQNTVTSGIISGYGRSVQAGDASGGNPESLVDLFQTDAAINEGNSGGPLVNLNGQVIGINTAIAGNAQNIGFAIPINDVTGLIKQVEATGKFERPYLGVRYISLTPEIAGQYKLNVNHGAFIAPSVDPASSPSVLSGSPADKAGLKESDVITKVDGVSIDQNHSLTSLIDQHSVGDTLNLSVVRDSKTININARLEAAPGS